MLKKEENTTLWSETQSKYIINSTHCTALTVVDESEHLLVDVVVQVHAGPVALALHEARRVQDLDAQ